MPPEIPATTKDIQDILTKISEISASTQLLRENLPLINQQISDLSKLTYSHNSLIEILSRNMDKNTDNMRLILSLQTEFEHLKEDMSDLSEKFDKSCDDFKTLSSEFDNYKTTHNTIKAEKSKKISALDYIKISSGIIAIITFLGSLAIIILRHFLFGV